MSVHERGRDALVNAAAGTWGEEVAETLSELLPRADQRLATQADVEGVLVMLDAVDARLEGRLDAVEGRLGAVEVRLDAVEVRLGAVEDALADLGRGLATLTERIDGIVHRVNADAERRFTDLVTSQTRSLMLSLFGTVVVIAALAFGLR